MMARSTAAGILQPRDLEAADNVGEPIGNHTQVKYMFIEI